MKKLLIALAVVPFVLSVSYAGETESKTERKLKSTFIPQLEFRNASFDDVMEYITQVSRDRCPDNKGINMVNLAQNIAAAPSRKVAAAPPKAADFFNQNDDFFKGDAVAEAPAKHNIPPVTINVRNMSMKEALDFITQMTGLKYHIKKDVVVITRQGQITEKVTKFYDVNDAAAINQALQQMQRQKQQQDGGAFDPFAR